MSTRTHPEPSYLQDIDTLPGDLAVHLVLVIEMPTKHLRGLVNGVFNLHGHTTAGLCLLDDLERT